METKFLKGPWQFERMESAEEFAKLQGKTLEEHEGYYRDNNGDWIVTFRDPDDDMGGRIAAVAFKGKAKRGETYKAPDPIGMANARLIAAAPDHADIGWALCVAAGRWEPWGDGHGEFVLNGIRFATKLDQFGIPEVTPALRTQIAKARGESV